MEDAKMFLENFNYTQEFNTGEYETVEKRFDNYSPSIILNKITLKCDGHLDICVSSGVGPECLRIIGRIESQETFNITSWDDIPDHILNVDQPWQIKINCASTERFVEKMYVSGNMWKNTYVQI